MDTEEAKRHRQKDIAAYEEFLCEQVEEEYHDGTLEEDLEEAPYHLPASLMNAIRGELCQRTTRPYSSALGEKPAPRAALGGPVFPTGLSFDPKGLSMSERLAKLGMDEFRGL